MDFTYTPSSRAPRARRRSDRRDHRLRGACEQERGLVPPRRSPRSAQAVLEHGLHAINMPAEWGGAGLSICSSRSSSRSSSASSRTRCGTPCGGRPTRCGMHARAARALPRCPASAASAATPSPITEADAGSDPLAPRARPRAATATAGVINGEKWFVTVGDVADYLHRPRRWSATSARRRCSSSTRTCPGSRSSAPRATCTRSSTSTPSSSSTDVSVGAEHGARRGRPGLRADPRLVRRGAADDRRARRRRRRARAASWPRVGRRARAGRRADRRPPADPGACSPTAPSTSPPTARSSTRSPGRPTTGLARKMLHAKAAMVKLAASEAAGRVVDRARADLRRPRLHAREPGRAPLPRACASTGSGRAPREIQRADHRQRDRQAGTASSSSPTAWPSPPSMLELTDEQREIQRVCRDFAAREIRPISLAVDEADTESALGDLAQGGAARAHLVHAARGVRRRRDDRRASRSAWCRRSSATAAPGSGT